MKMEDLNKTQIVLLTLLTSFVTSIATGIVTVTLMDQAPPAVTRTINRVVEKTIQTVVPGENQVTTVVKEVVVKEGDLLVSAVEKSSKSLVQVGAIDEDGNGVMLSLGVVVSGDGFIVTDKERIDGNRNNLIISTDGKSMDAEVVSEEDDFVILKAVEPENIASEDGSEGVNTDEEAKNNEIDLTPISLVDSNKIKLGQTVASLAGSDGATILTGIVSRLDKETVVEDTENADDVKKSSEVLKYIVPSFEIDKKSAGGPLIDTGGNLLGVNVITSTGKVLSVPANAIKDALLSMNNTSEEPVAIGENPDSGVEENKGDLTDGE